MCAFQSGFRAWASEILNDLVIRLSLVQSTPARRALPCIQIARSKYQIELFLAEICSIAACILKQKQRIDSYTITFPYVYFKMYT